MSKIITRQADLEKFCAGLKKESFITVDTEFIRDSSYWSKLCLIQVAAGSRESAVAAIDPLSGNIDLAPFYDLLLDKKILKVMHGSRQDIEIFYHDTGKMPQSVFDTQIAGMVCGFGDQIGYEKLVKTILGKDIDKSSRFTDWSKRPLNDRQLDYALSDVTFLRDIYKKIAAMIEKSGRDAWIEEEVSVLLSPRTYDMDPKNAWKRLKVRTHKKDVIARLQVLAAWREEIAQKQNRPRNRILRDDVLQNLALHKIETREDFDKTRRFPRDLPEKALMNLLERLKKAKTPAEMPEKQKQRGLTEQAAAIIELLRVLLKYVCEEENIAPKLLASAQDLEDIALSDKADVPALKGWRYDVFGKKALALKHGEYAVAIKGGKIKFFPLP
ncbi:MAG: ribonuclease D [Micavibrio sp.]|nr:MAG: ribonuclease D [Micavibrio sp.]